MKIVSCGDDYMLMQEPTEEIINEWKDIFNKNKNFIKPNKKDGLEIIEYLKLHYSVTEIQNNELEKIVESNVKDNEFNSNKLKGANPIIRVFKVNRENTELYKIQDKIFDGIDIIVGIEIKTSFIYVEGSSYLYDELTAFTGLDEEDIKNYFLVAEYIKCKEKFDL